ncbi:type VI secretion system baseplate subunit TssF [Pseudoduganella sp.]|uniref:type VI secretion system baseplate subunit TssF n=1 Tax=Pseudoduganella sp. TaxID=1880898 RepID=UPI0035B30BF2
MEQILPMLERQLRHFRRDGLALAARHPRLAGQLGAGGGAADAHVDRLVQGVASVHARAGLALQRAAWQTDEHLLQCHFPQQLRIFPACRIGPGPDAAPLAIVAARLCRGCDSGSALIELDIECSGALPGGAVDLHIDGDAAFSAALRTALLGGAASLDAGIRFNGGEWQRLAEWPFAPCGLEPGEALLPRPAGEHAGLALLRELLVCPERFNLVRLKFPLPCGGRQTATLRLPLAAGRGSDAALRLLAGLEASRLRVGWTASAMLFPTAAAPVRLDGRQAEYLVSVPPELEIFSIDRVSVGGERAEGWVARQAPGAPAGHEWRIAMGRRWPDGAVVSIDTSCAQRASVLARPGRGPACRWQLNSLLALELLPASAQALRELMATQAIHPSPAAHAMIGAVQSLEARSVLLQPARAAPLAGTELRLHIDEAPFAGCGLLLFAQVMERFFGECAHLNTFTRLVLVSARTGEELIRCKARNGATLLE